MKLQKSLKNVLTINFILIAVLPILIVGIVSHSLLTQSLSKAITAKNLSLAQSLSGEVETFLTHPLSVLKQVREVVDAQDLITNKSMDSLLGSIIRNYTLFDMIQILDSNGIVKFISPYNHEFIGNNMSNLPFYQSTIRGKKHFWSPTFISMQTGNPTLTLSLPIKDGIIVGYLNLKILSDITGKIQESGHGFAIITDQKGNTLAHPEIKNVTEQLNLKNLIIVSKGLSGNEGTYEDILGQEEVIGSISIVPQTRWLVIIIQKSSDAFALVFKVKLIIAIGVLCTAIIAVLIALGSLEKTLKPLSFLISRFKRVAGGKYDITDTLPKSYYEINELSDNFEKMTEAVRDRENSLQDRERLYRSLVEAIPYGIQDNDLEGTITFTNSAYDLIMGCSEGERIGLPIWANAVNSSDKRQLQEYFTTLVKEQPLPTPYITKISTEKGNKIELQVDWDYRRDSQGKLTGFISVITDITDRKMMEESLRQSQKMEAIGTLTGGIAHDFNNILAAILGYSELVLDDLPHESESREDLEAVIDAAKRAKDLVKHMLTFSRKTEQDVGPIEIYLVVKEALKLLRASIPSTIRIIQDIDVETGVVKADPTQIHQVLMNLCTNATHAMEDHGGVLEVHLGATHLTEGDLATEPELNPGPYINLSVSDTGKGINPELIGRIFDPFFTTKETGKGTGMGLSVVHGVVKKHGGMIKVKSILGGGTKFDIFLPKEEIEYKQEIKSIGPLPVGNESILVIDDEKPILNMIKVFLERQGYKVTIESKSKNAFALFCSQPEAFDLIISDQTMPDMTGEHLAYKVLDIRKDMPIILCTGFSSSIDKEKSLAAGIKAFVMKPISHNDLAVLIRKVLDN